MANDRQYLENCLHDKKLELRETEIKHRIACAEFKVLTERLYKEIDSLEKHLNTTNNN